MSDNNDHAEQLEAALDTIKRLSKLSAFKSAALLQRDSNAMTFLSSIRDEVPSERQGRATKRRESAGVGLTTWLLRRRRFAESTNDYRLCAMIENIYDDAPLLGKELNNLPALIGATEHIVSNATQLLLANQIVAGHRYKVLKQRFETDFKGKQGPDGQVMNTLDDFWSAIGSGLSTRQIDRHIQLYEFCKYLPRFGLTDATMSDILKYAEQIKAVLREDPIELKFWRTTGSTDKRPREVRFFLTDPREQKENTGAPFLYDKTCDLKEVWEAIGGEVGEQSPEKRRKSQEQQAAPAVGTSGPAPPVDTKPTGSQSAPASPGLLMGRRAQQKNH